VSWRSRCFTLAGGACSGKSKSGVIARAIFSLEPPCRGGTPPDVRDLITRIGVMAVASDTMSASHLVETGVLSWSQSTNGAERAMTQVGSRIIRQRMGHGLASSCDRPRLVGHQDTIRGLPRPDQPISRPLRSLRPGRTPIDLAGQIFSPGTYSQITMASPIWT
jgi:hypothetical protein